MKKILSMLIVIVMVGSLVGCGKKNDISVISREEGSGTRDAFVELFGVMEKDKDGNKVDHTSIEAQITQSTSVVITTVSGDKNAIGYISLGTLNDTVKALKIDGVEATVENINNGTYKIARPFNIATKGEINEVTQDFIDFILSADGQAVIKENKYIAVSDNAAYSGSKPSGTVTVAGSSSVTPVMQSLKEAYEKINTNANIKIQESDSSTGMTSVIEGVCDIGMASRELKASEVEKGAVGQKIAMDGIAVIVNKDNDIEGLSSQEVKDIFTGKTTTWK